MEKDRKRVELLLKKFQPNILRLAVYYLSFDGTLSQLKEELNSHKEYHSDLRILYDVLSNLDQKEIAELIELSKNIAMNKYDIDDIIPM